MIIRTFQAGDDVAQVSIYNEVGNTLPKFKPATVDEVRRRCRASDFDPASRFYALENGKVVGYITFQPHGRISFPWCRGGHEHFQEPLLAQAQQAMKQRGISTAFAAYRGDWPTHRDFFLAHGYTQVREMINYVVDIVEMPTPAARLSSLITPLTPADIPDVIRLGKGILRVTDPALLEENLFRNPHFPPSSLFALRSKADEHPVAIGLVITNANYANPKQLDACMPCFRLGAFGTETYSVKRTNGLFSMIAEDSRDFTAHGLDLLGYATNKIGDTDLETFAAQIPSDAPHLVRFYKSLFRRQGSFPIFERIL